jgi:hypothetical protein
MNKVNCTSIRRGFDCGATGFADCAMRLTHKGRGMVAVDDYASLIDPTGEAMPRRCGGDIPPSNDVTDPSP